MNELIKKIVYMLLALQEKFARRKHEKMLKKLQKTTSKTVLTGSCSLNFSAKTEENKIKLENNIKSILKNSLLNRILTPPPVFKAIKQISLQNLTL